MSQNLTIDRILDVAESLFSEKGFAETSLRSITSEAGVNLAAVNYHFGSKQKLIQAVFARFLDPFSEHLNIQLQERYGDSAENPPELKELLELFAYTIYAMRSERLKTKDHTFVRLIGLAYNQGEGHLLKFIRTQYGDIFARYMALYKQACPKLSDQELFWRVHFALGSALFSLSGFEILESIAPKGSFTEPLNVITVYKYIIPFIVAGLNAEPLK
jgi:AcrR family transcriptional regulator